MVVVIIGVISLVVVVVVVIVIVITIVLAVLVDYSRCSINNFYSCSHGGSGSGNGIRRVFVVVV